MPFKSDAGAGARGVAFKSDAGAGARGVAFKSDAGAGARSVPFKSDTSVGAATWMGSAPAYPICLVDGDCPQVFSADDPGVVLLDDAEVAFPLHLTGQDAVRLDYGDCELAPACASAGAGGATGDVV